MRIAYITQAYPPILSGASLVAGQLADTMAARGHQVLVIAPSERGRRCLIQNRNLSVLRLRSYRNPLRAHQRFMLFPRGEVLQALYKFHPDVIHSHDPLQMGMLSLEYARQTHVPIATTVHQLPWFVSKNLPDVEEIRAHAEAALWEYAGWLLHQHASVITPSQTVSDMVMQMTGIQAQVISNGVDLSTFHPAISPQEAAAVRAKLGLPLSVPIILHVGQLHTAKRPDCVIRAFAEVIQQSDAYLLIVGDGPQKAELMDMCVKLGIADRTHFPGFISVQQGLAQIYRLSTLFVTASEIETQGIVLLEAVASGLPIAAVRATCIPEIVHQGKNGYLAEAGDIDGLCKAMLKILGSPALARAMGHQSHCLAQRHAIEKTMDAYEQLYLESLSCRTYTAPPIGAQAVAD